jgi:cellulose synthase/poly-beta-1,6-N-acetylglucosamine synthase-like glycosyltransferase
VLFSKDTLQKLVRNFEHKNVGLVDSKMVNHNLKKDGISFQEKTYISGEVALKSAEGKLFGAMMGPFGGCFAMRNELFKEVPMNFLVDDFYLNMCVLEQRKSCINEPEAIVFEDVSNNLASEFKRKIRISAGNFQNLIRFFPLLFRFNGVSFSFFSHKVLRWFGPFFLLGLAFSQFQLLTLHPIYYYSALLSIVLAFCSFMDVVIFLPARKNLPVIRYFTHFFAMNLALFLGLIKFLSGIKSSVWEPTERNQ